MAEYTYDELNEAICALKKSSEKVFTNNCYLPGDLKNKILNGTLTFRIHNNSIIIYESFKDFVNVFFYINEKTEEIPADSEKPLKIDIISNKSKAVEPFVNDVLENSGFKFLRTAYSMTLSEFQGIDRMEIKNRIMFAQQDMINGIIKLWNEVFVAEDSYIHSLQETQALIDSKRIIVSTDENQQVTGTLASIPTGAKSAMIIHVGVDKAFRGKGIGKDMLAFCLQNREIIGASRVSLWVEDYRKAAMEMYKKFGFQYTGKEMKRYIK